MINMNEKYQNMRGELEIIVRDKKGRIVDLKRENEPKNKKSPDGTGNRNAK